MKQLKSIILLTLLMCMVGAKVFAYNAKINGIYYNFSGTNAIVTSDGILPGYYTGSVVIPETVTYNGTTYTVTSIGNSAFYHCSGLTRVTIPNSVTSIGGKAFYGCSGLTNINIPNSVTSIGYQAFIYCYGLTSVNIPYSVTSIADQAFSGCSGLTSVTIGNSVTSIGILVFDACSCLTEVNYNATNCTSMGSYDYPVFKNCSSLTTLNIGDNVQIIPAYAFYGCSGLISVTIPNSVTSIGNSAFYHCSGLTSMTIPNSVTSIGSGAFSGCSGLTSVTIPNSMTNIGSYAFSGCSGLMSVTIPNSVTSIGEKAFSSCQNLESVTIGTGVLNIGESVFNNHKPAKVIWLTNTPPSGYKNAEGMVNYVANNLYTQLNNKTEYPFLSSLFEVGGVKYVPVSPSERTCDAIDCLYDERAENVNIGETVSFKGVEMTVQRVHQYACYRNPYIKNVECDWNGNVEDYSFYGCTKINQIKASNGGNIGTSAFQGITSECTANINNSGYIGDKAFYQSTGIKTLEVGSNVTDINSSAFYECTGLTSAQLQNNGNIGGSAIQGCTGLTTATIMNKGVIGASAFQGCTAMTTATIGEAVTGIGSEAFRGCSSLQSIVIPNAVMNLGKYAFYGCSQMTSVKMGTGVKTISTYAFAGSSSLTDMQIGSKVETIMENAFNNCKALPEIEIPKSVKTINNYVFRGCSGLKDVLIADRDTILTLGSNGSSSLFSDCPLDSVYIGGNINYNTSSNYGYSPFYRNTSLRTVVITDKETEISENEFYGCTNLQDVKIGDGVESFGNWAFSGCSSLKHFAFGMSVERIGKEAFSDCTAMESIASRSPEPPVCGSQALDDINKWECVLTVPAGNKAAYMAADQWKEFFFVEEGEAVNKFVTVSIEKSEGGKVLVNDKEETEVSLKRGSDVTFKFIADEGHSLAQVLINGEDVTGQVTEGSYTLKEVFADVTVKATFSVNSYKLIYLVDGEEYKTLDVDYGTAITPEESPEKEGYTFSGWSEIPATMPAHDVTVTGTFSINSYMLTYLLDGEEYKKMEVVYGSAITPEASPVKEGYTFSGWSEIPATMPAHDMTVTGTMIPNLYQLVYLVDGLEYKTVDVPFGSAITPEPEPEKEGYTFSGWIGLPETMPARLVIVTGTFSINSYTLTYMIGDELYKQVVYEYGATITSEPQPEGDYVSFEWVGVPETMPAHDVTVTAVYETGIAEIIMMAQQGQVRIYAPNGKRLDKLQKGLNIVVMQDGTTKKVVVK